MIGKEQHIRFANDELIGQGNLSVINEIFTADYVAHAGDKEYCGYDFIRGFALQIRSAIPDLRVVRIKCFLETADTLTWQRTLSGTHKENMMGIPPSHKKVTWNEMLVSRFIDNKIAEEWVVSELAGELLLKQPVKK